MELYSRLLPQRAFGWIGSDWIEEMVMVAFGVLGLYRPYWLFVSIYLSSESI